MTGFIPYVRYIREYGGRVQKLEIAKCDIKLGRKAKVAICFYGAWSLMLSSVLNNSIAIEVSIQIMRIYTKMREMLLTHKNILLKLEQLERPVGQHSEDIRMIFAALKKLLPPTAESRPRIGFRRKDEQD